MLSSLRGLVRRTIGFMAPSVAKAAQAIGRQVAKLPPVKKRKAAQREEALRRKRRFKAVRRFLSYPRWYQDIIRPHFRGQRRKYGNRPTSSLHQALAMQHADDKRRRRRERNLRHVAAGGYHDHATGYERAVMGWDLANGADRGVRVTRDSNGRIVAMEGAA